MARSCKLLPKTEVTLVLTWTSHVRFALFHSHSLNLRLFLFVHFLEEQVLLLFTTKQFSTRSAFFFPHIIILFSTIATSINPRLTAHRNQELSAGRRQWRD